MPDADSDDRSRLPAPLRSVTPLSDYRPNAGMDAIGWGIFLGMVILLVPLLPFILIVWLIAKVTDAVTPS